MSNSKASELTTHLLDTLDNLIPHFYFDLLLDSCQLFGRIELIIKVNIN